MREYVEDMKSGKRDKMDEAEDTLGRFEYEIESTKRSDLHNLLNLLKLKTS
ncbi:BnaCnng39390D [Brassica napus]|uniref:BnaCnng39390D protein n=1 Tax=Brassica napus TaxID=3708 RepID=A0A078JCY0_BRANA|nr:BnaCnng39390D [Brassica napus]